MHRNDTVSFVIDRNINYTNVCVAQCSFCAFRRERGHAQGYVLPWEVIDQKCQELVEQGGTQVLLQGGLNPALKLDYYQELIHRIQSRFPPLVVHGFSPAEVHYLAQLSRLTVTDCLRELQAAGLQSLPGGGGEILVDRVRARISRGKVLTHQWFAVMEEAGRLGINITATMMYGHIETVAERALHLLRIRESGAGAAGTRPSFTGTFSPRTHRCPG